MHAHEHSHGTLVHSHPHSHSAGIDHDDPHAHDHIHHYDDHHHEHIAGNELAARVRLRGGRRLRSPALIADGNHARVDGYVSLSVIASAFCVWVGLDRADP